MIDVIGMAGTREYHLKHWLSQKGTLPTLTLLMMSLVHFVIRMSLHLGVAAATININI